MSPTGPKLPLGPGNPMDKNLCNTIRFQIYVYIQKEFEKIIILILIKLLVQQNHIPGNPRSPFNPSKPGAPG